MSRLKTLAWVTASVALVAAAAGQLTSVPSLAQVRAALVRDVDNPALQPIHFGSFNYITQPNWAQTQDIYTVPAGKRLVIENASIWALSDSTSKANGIWLVGKNNFNYLLLDPADDEYRLIYNGSTNLAAYNRTIKAYFNPGEILQTQVFGESTSLSGYVNVNIYFQGYLVTL
jgi:hypothetical protein